MTARKPGPSTIAEYIAQCPKNVQPVLRKLRAVIKEAAPGATEKISYAMPGFHLNGMLVWFAPRENYIGFYPTAEGIEAFQKELAAYKCTKGSAHFPLDEPMPYGLIRKIVKYRVARNLKKSSSSYKR